MNLLLNRYHPVVDDLAESFSKLEMFDEIDIAIDISIKDHYGNHLDILNKNKEKFKEFNSIPTSLAFLNLKNKKYDLVGIDGVFTNDQEIMDICKESNIPWFCINGYPHQIDEPSNNILAFSWHLPFVQYKKANPHEGYVKERDWKNIAEKGRSDGKNICVFYPEMNEAKRYIRKIVKLPDPEYFSSFIHRYKECNKWNYEVFSFLEMNLDWNNKELKNYSGLKQSEVFEKISKSYGVVHLKHADCPGITILESLVLGVPIITMSSFVKASLDQEFLIDNFTAIIADSKQELVDRSIELMKDGGLLEYSSKAIRNHSWILTDFERQEYKLRKFFERCINV